MRCLVDANLSHHIAGTLSDAGFEASHVVDGHLWNASDEVIAEHAIAHGQTIISADSDFATNLRYVAAPHHRWSCCAPWTD